MGALATEYDVIAIDLPGCGRSRPALRGPGAVGRMGSKSSEDEGSHAAHPEDLDMLTLLLLTPM